MEGVSPSNFLFSRSLGYTFSVILVDPRSPDTWVEKALQFIENNLENSGVEEVLPKLRQLSASGRIRVRDIGPNKLGGYNRLTGRITLNSSKFGFLRRDFRRLLEGLEASDASEERLRLVREQHALAVLELSGVLIHEGQHALRFLWNRAADETSAFRTEQRWYYHLHTLESPLRNAIESLARDAEYDASNSPSYLGVRVNAPCLIEVRAERHG